MTPTLTAAREAVAAARARHDADTAALGVAREQLIAAKAALDSLAADDEAAVARHARRLETRARKGDAGAPPALVPSATHVAAHLTATQTHSAARLTVTNLEGAVRESAKALAVAEEELQTAARAALSEEADKMSDELEAMRRELEEREQVLRACCSVPGFSPSLKVFRALRDSLNIPLNELSPTGSWDRAWNTPVSERDRVPVDAQAFWAARLAALITGDPTSDRETHQEVAA